MEFKETRFSRSIIYSLWIIAFTSPPSFIALIIYLLFLLSCFYDGCYPSPFAWLNLRWLMIRITLPRVTPRTTPSMLGSCCSHKFFVFNPNLHQIHFFCSIYFSNSLHKKNNQNMHKHYNINLENKLKTPNERIKHE